MLENLLENLLVAVIVLLAAGYALAKYLPAGWRQRIVYFLARRGADQSTMARWFNTEAGCGSGCDSCKACADPAPAVPAEPAAPGAARVIKLHRRP
ncbi:MAG TPA: DUF6587 family protein [Telluria sp.]